MVGWLPRAQVPPRIVLVEDEDADEQQMGSAL